jgi:hypothetical protein
VATITAKSNTLGGTGLIVYVSELDVNGNNEIGQGDIWKRVFTVLYENSHTYGLTF